MKITVIKEFKHILDKKRFLQFLSYINTVPESLDTLKKHISKNPVHMVEPYLKEIYTAIFGYCQSKVQITRELELYFFLLREISGSLKYNILRNDGTGLKTRKEILNLFKEFNEKISPAAVYHVFKGQKTKTGILSQNGNFELTGKSLHRFFRYGSDEVFPLVLYVVTIGKELDQQVKSWSGESGDIYKAYILNAIGAGFTDAVAYDLQLYLSDLHRNHLEGTELLRISPGYGDWKLSDQRVIFNVLTPPETIGVSLNESFLMNPLKSTSGLMGPAKRGKRRNAY